MKELFTLKKALLGKGAALFAWDTTSSYLATVGSTRNVHVFTRNGSVLDTFLLPGNTSNKPISMCWDHSATLLAIICDGSHILSLWSIHTRQLKQIDISMKDPTFAAFHKHQAILAIGTSKGSLLLYNADTCKSTVVAAKHSKKITCGSWSNENKLALASIDKVMTVSDEKGELLEQTKLKYDPYDVAFSAAKMDNATKTTSETNINATSTNPNDQEQTVSVNMGHQTILMYNLNDSDNPVELAFQPKYGEICSYKWFGDGYMMIGFSRGFVIAISTHMREIGEELQSVKLYEHSLSHLIYSQQLNRLCTAGDDGIRIIDCVDWKEIKGEGVTFSHEEGDVDHMEWTRDGQILTVSTTGGYVFNYMTAIPLLAAASTDGKVACLSSLRHVSVTDVNNDQTISFEVAVEPAFIAIGNAAIGVGMNNHGWFYNNQHSDTQLMVEKEYIGSVIQMYINNTHAAVLCDNKRIHVHSLIPPTGEERDQSLLEERSYPINDMSQSSISSFVLTNDFLIYAMTDGHVYQISIHDGAAVNEHKHHSPLTHIYTNPLGTRLIFIDQNSNGILYSPIDDLTTEIPSFPSSSASAVINILFDQVDQNTFVVVDQTNHTAITYIYISHSTKGSYCSKVGVTKLVHHFVPILFYDGILHGQKINGSLTTIVLSTHDTIQAQQQRYTHHHQSNDNDRQRQQLTQLIALGRLRQAYEMSSFARSQPDTMQMMARKALEQCDLELAIKIYRSLNETAIVMALKELMLIEDKYAVAAHINVMNGDYTRAQQLFLQSTTPLEALNMRRDLLHWDHALKLAATLSVQDIPIICREYANQLEMKGDYVTALAMYQRCLTESQTLNNNIQETAELLDDEDDDHDNTINNIINRNNNNNNVTDYISAMNTQSKRKQQMEENVRLSEYGIARMTIRLGEIQRGIQLALASNHLPLMRECGSILEQMKQYNDAADMYAYGQHYERAVTLYNQLNLFGSKSSKYISKISTPKLILQYAQYKEKEGQYEEACTNYLRANDKDSCIRLYLESLDKPDLAFQMARESKSIQSAHLIATYCITILNDFNSAIEFYLLAKRSDEAFNLAKKYNKMNIYGNILADDGTYTEYKNLAEYYENELHDDYYAGIYYNKLNQYSKALSLFIKYEEVANKLHPPTTLHIDAAIDCVAKSMNITKENNNNNNLNNSADHHETLIRTLHDFLIGEHDGKVKDLMFIFRLYMKIGEYTQAASTAILIANQEQSCGQYNTAHQILVTMYLDLLKNNLLIPNELKKNLLLLHSYRLAKKFSTEGNHIYAARMLIRVANNISKFPSHIVPILTSTVIECQRAGLKKTSFEYASTLMRTEYRGLIDIKYRKPIEAFVRRPVTTEDNESTSPCIYCGSALFDTALECTQCTNTQPWCAVTGMHMTTKDFTVCPQCQWPCKMTAFLERITADKSCPLCSKAVDIQDVKLIDDVKGYLVRQNQAAQQQQAAAAAAMAGGANGLEGNMSAVGSVISSARNSISLKSSENIFGVPSALDIQVKF